MGSVGYEVAGGGLALLPTDTSQNAEMTRKFMADTGLDVDSHVIMNTDGDVLKDVYDTIRDMKKRYPTFFSHIDKISDYDDNNSFAATNGTTLRINTAYFGNTQGLDTLYASTVASGYHPAGTTWKDIDVHEMGHMAVRAIGEKLYSDKTQLMRDWKNGKLPARLVHEAYAEIQSAPNSYGFRGKIPTERALRGAICRYALQNYHETVAEAWADYHANGNASKALSRAIVAIMQKYQ